MYFWKDWVTVLVEPTIACTLSGSTSCLTSWAAFAGLAPSSTTMTFTGWSSMPPLAFV